ncbi:MAG: endonuclease/exonuclease/phosphatase family protein [Bacteroidaceae bacterium]|nr:endonuclease/exonuclease/phosphatase family protein [Bacteroidaceae bacterium]
MKTKKLLLLICFMMSGMVATMADIRVMTYNIRHGAGLDNVTNLERTAKAIEAWNADFVALQEVDSCATRTKSVDQATELGRLTLMRPTFAAAIPLQGGKYGVALLSKERPLSVRRIAMPNNNEDRVLLVCEFKNCVIANTHLSLSEADHDASADIIIAEAQRCTKPFIIMGDWNSKPDSPFIKRMKQHFTFVSDTRKATFPADKPVECIDYIAVYKSQPAKAVKKSFRVVEEKAASDHRPLVADLVLKTPGNRLMTFKPYLQDPKPTEMTVMFQTNAVCHAWVEYGTDSLNTTTARTLLDGQEVCFDIENRIVLKNLKPGEKYYYRVCLVGLTYKRAYETHFGDTLKTCFYQFKTPSDNAKDFTAIIFNDLHRFRSSLDSLVARLKGTDYDFVVFNGDCLPEPYDRDEAVRMIHDIADPVNGAEKPIFFMRGNHEIRDFYSAGMHRLIGYPNDLTYGAFNWGDTRFVMLDLGEDKPDDTWVYYGLNDFTSLRNDQTLFLQKELKSREFRKASRRVLLSHIPIFGNVDKYQPCKEMWGPMLQKQPFDIYLTAHVHELMFEKNGIDGTSFPVFRGGGPGLKECGVAVLSKKGDTMHLKVLTTTGVFVDTDL